MFMTKPSKLFPTTPPSPFLVSDSCSPGNHLSSVHCPFPLYNECFSIPSKASPFSCVEELIPFAFKGFTIIFLSSFSCLLSSSLYWIISISIILIAIAV